MGIEGLWQWSSQYLEISSMSLNEKRVAIDTNYYLNKYFYTLPVSLLGREEIVVKLIYHLKQRDHKFKIQDNVASVCWLFDGPPLDTKKRTALERENARRQTLHRAELGRRELDQLEVSLVDSQRALEEALDSSSTIDQSNHVLLTTLSHKVADLQCQRQQKTIQVEKRENHARKLDRSMIAEVQRQCRELGMLCLECESETDFQMAGSGMKGDFDVVFTGDSDILLTHVKAVARNLEAIMDYSNPSNLPTSSIEILRPESAWLRLGWTQAMYVDFGLLLGHDQDHMKIKGIGPVYAEFLIGHTKSIERILDLYNDFMDKKQQLKRSEEEEDATNNDNCVQRPLAKKRKATAAPKVEFKNMTPEEKQDFIIAKIQTIPADYKLYIATMRQLFLDPPHLSIPELIKKNNCKESVTLESAHQAPLTLGNPPELVVDKGDM